MKFQLLSMLPKIGVAMILGATICVGFTGTHANDDDAVKRFFELREQLLDQRGTPAKVDQLLSLFEEGAHYEHPGVSVVMTMNEARSGMIAHLSEGRDAKITTRRLLHGPNFTVVETTLNYLLPDESSHWKKVEKKGVTIFEMDDNRIVRVAEY